MTPEKTTLELRTPPLISLRMPMDVSAYGMAASAQLLWRPGETGKQMNTTHASGTPADEYKTVCEFMRLYATLRFYQLALLLGTSGSIVTALSTQAARLSFIATDLLRAGGMIISLAFLVMEFRATSYWHRLRDRGNELAQRLGYQPFPVSSRWDPLTTSGASLYLHSFVAALWLTSLLLHVQSGR